MISRGRSAASIGLLQYSTAVWLCDECVVVFFAVAAGVNENGAIIAPVRIDAAAVRAAVALTLSPGYLRRRVLPIVRAGSCASGGPRAAIPWEYESPPVRSWLPVAVLTGLPIYLLRYWTPFTPGAMALLAASRLPYCVASFAVDFVGSCIPCFSPRTGGDLLPPLLLLHASVADARVRLADVFERH